MCVCLTAWFWVSLGRDITGRDQYSFTLTHFPSLVRSKWTVVRLGLSGEASSLACRAFLRSSRIRPWVFLGDDERGHSVGDPRAR